MVPTRAERYVQLLGFTLVLIAAYLLRVYLLQGIEGHPTDINNFRSWCIHVSTHAFRDFYQSEVPGTAANWADYPPLYILILRGVGQVFMWTYDPGLSSEGQRAVLTFLVKQPAILADLAIACLIFYFFRGLGKTRLGWLCCLLFLFHPVALYNSAVWGQMDSLTLLLQLLTVYALFREKYALALVWSCLNCLIKPQGLILLPLVFFVMCWQRRWRDLAIGSFISGVIAYGLIWIFIPFRQVLPWLFAQYTRQAELYPYLSAQAFNLWSLWGFVIPDASWGEGLLQGFVLSPKWLGLGLFGGIYLALLILFWYRHPQNPSPEGFYWLFATSALILMAFFLFPTRMHERYLYSGLFFLLVAAGLNRSLWAAFGCVSVTHFLNLVFEYPGEHGVSDLWPVLMHLNAFTRLRLNEHIVVYHVLALLNLLVFAALCYAMYVRPLPKKALGESAV